MYSITRNILYKKPLICCLFLSIHPRFQSQHHMVNPICTMNIQTFQASLVRHCLPYLVLMTALYPQTNAFAIPKALLKRAPTCDATPGSNPLLADCQAALAMMPGNGGYQTYAPNNGATPLANNLGPLFYQSGKLPRESYRVDCPLTYLRGTGTCVITVNPSSLDYSFPGTIRSIAGGIITTCVQGSGIGGTDTSGANATAINGQPKSRY